MQNSSGQHAEFQAKTVIFEYCIDCKGNWK